MTSDNNYALASCFWYIVKKWYKYFTLPIGVTTHLGREREGKREIGKGKG